MNDFLAHAWPILGALVSFTFLPLEAMGMKYGLTFTRWLREKAGIDPPTKLRYATIPAIWALFLWLPVHFTTGVL